MFSPSGEARTSHGASGGAFFVIPVVTFMNAPRLASRPAPGELRENGTRALNFVFFRNRELES
jgi:hypothetical protein